MRKLIAKIAGREHALEFWRDGERVAAAVDGRQYELEVRELASENQGGEYLLINGTDVYKCRVGKKRDGHDSFEVIARGKSYDVTLIDPKRLRSAQSSGGHDPGVAQVISPMPGKIVRVLVEPGAQVEAGAGIVVVEAMKMQNEMKAPKAGVVASINAEAGATVNAGDVLAVIE
ncbi:MAG: biotin/lipoyl-containing protein [Pyrinomonadaceae bacterium]